MSPIDDSLREELSALLDGALPAERAADLRRRIEADADLRREYAELERAVKRVRDLPRASAPPELRARVRSSLGGGRARGPVFRLAWIAVAATVLLAAGLALYLRRDRPVEFEAKQEVARRDSRLKEDDAAAPAEVLEEAVPALAKDTAGKETEGGRGEAKRLGDTKSREGKAIEIDLVRAVETGKNVAPADRKGYLRQLAALEPEAARKHIVALGRGAEAAVQREGLPGARAGPPVLATITVADQEEATLVSRVLSSAVALGGTAASASLEERDELATHVEGTPEELAQIGRWLLLLDIARDPARPKPSFAAKGPKLEKQDAPRVRAVVRLKYAAPSEARPPGR